MNGRARRLVTTVAVVAVAVITAVLIVNGGGATPGPTPGSPAAPAALVAGSGVTRPGPSTGAGAAGRAAAPVRAVSNVPMRRLRPGEKPPQFIIFSFDGAGSHEKWQEFLGAASGVHARFTGFLTGLYLLADENKARYTGPGHSAGRSSVGFGGTPAEVATRISDLNRAYAAGHEIGTHYNGHFCSGAEPSGGVWSSAAWSSELGQFFGFFDRYRQDNPGVRLPTLTVPKQSIKGGRTPCLEGRWDQLVPVWKAAGMTYDSSMNAPTMGLSWPRMVDGIWEFAMPYVYSPGFGGMVVNMDYNMWVKFNGGRVQPGTEIALRDKVYRTYTSLYDKALAGNHAPILVANHFNNWNGNSFNPAVLEFMTNYCARKNTVCATYSDVIAWMRLQTPAVLRSLQALPPVAASATT